MNDKPDRDDEPAKFIHTPNVEPRDDGNQHFEDILRAGGNFGDQQYPWCVFKISYANNKEAQHICPNEAGHHSGIRDGPHGPESTCPCQNSTEVIDHTNLIVTHNWRH